MKGRAGLITTTLAMLQSGPSLSGAYLLGPAAATKIPSVEASSLLEMTDPAGPTQRPRLPLSGARPVLTPLCGQENAEIGARNHEKIYFSSFQLKITEPLQCARSRDTVGKQKTVPLRDY